MLLLGFLSIIILGTEPTTLFELGALIISYAILGLLIMIRV